MRYTQCLETFLPNWQELVTPCMWQQSLVSLKYLGYKKGWLNGKPLEKKTKTNQIYPSQVIQHKLEFLATILKDLFRFLKKKDNSIAYDINNIIPMVMCNIGSVMLWGLYLFTWDLGSD